MHAGWSRDSQIEHDLLITMAMVAIFSDPFLSAIESVIRDGTFSAGEIYELVLPAAAHAHPRKEKRQPLTAGEPAGLNLPEPGVGA